MDRHSIDCPCTACDPNIGEFSDYGRDDRFAFWAAGAIVLLGLAFWAGLWVLTW